jgi:hypothetical protein
VNSTYFILLNSQNYNPRSTKSVKLIRSIVSMGHEIGLHFDPYSFVLDTGSLNNNLAEECQTLSNIAESEVKSVSQHRPTELGVVNEDHSFIDAYQVLERYNISYSSDSGGEWWSECMCHSLNSTRPQVILTHPIHWIDSSLDWKKKQFLLALKDYKIRCEEIELLDRRRQDYLARRKNTNE